MSAVSRSDENSPPRLFGTDGVRDRFGQGLLAPECVERIFGATASTLERADEFPNDFQQLSGRRVLVGRDTRASGRTLLEIAARALGAYGYQVVDVGVLPTPGVAYLARSWEGVCLGVVISASHNPAEYNGIKFFAPTGAKVSPEFERAVESECAAINARASAGEQAVDDECVAARRDYVAYLVGSCWRPERLTGRSVLLDAAHGAAYEVAPQVFERLGMKVELRGASPDGENINDGVGALYPDRLAKGVKRANADVGFCFDGDGDRMIPITGAGTVLDGDHVLALAGKHLLKSDRLPLCSVVATVMSNVGLEVYLKSQGIELLRTDVGDRNVYLEMVAGPHPVGGEQSGHTIFLDDASTGDGILSGLRLLDVLESDDLDLEGESRVMQRFPQVLKNVEVAEKLPFEKLSGVLEAVQTVEAQLEGMGRVLLRYSGTEPLARVMVEGPDRKTTDEYTDRICETIRRASIK